MTLLAGPEPVLAKNEGEKRGKKEGGGKGGRKGGGGEEEIKGRRGTPGAYDALSARGSWSAPASTPST